MLIYEVNLRVDEEVAEAFAAWLRAHMREMLAFDGFEEARWYRLEPDTPGQVRWTTHYHVQNAESLDTYLRDHAAAMREDGLKRFGGKFSADRRILEEEARF